MEIKPKGKKIPTLFLRKIKVKFQMRKSTKVLAI